MSYEIRADYSEIHLFPPALEDWVGEDHPARFLRSFVDALDLGALGFRERASADGRPNYAADVSKGGAWHRADLARLLERLDTALVEAEEQVEAAEQSELGAYRLPEQLQDAEALRAAIKEALGQLDAAQRDHLHPTDSEARMMPCDGKKAFAYNAQVVVDEASGVVVAEAVINEKRTILFDVDAGGGRGGRGCDHGGNGGRRGVCLRRGTGACRGAGLRGDRESG